MKITSSQVGMESARTFRSRATRTLAVSYGTQQNTNANGILSWNGSIAELLNSNGKINEGTETVSNNDTAGDTPMMDLLKNSQAQNAERIKTAEPLDTQKAIQDFRQQFLYYFWQIFFGEEDAQKMAESYGFESGTQSLQQGMPVLSVQGVRETYYEEFESVSFKANGNVQTDDGREINFNIQVNMSREFTQYYREEGLVIPAMCDPLVMNFNGSIADLSDQTFYFDLDMDGEKEEISQLAAGNGFLALDKNEDGTINDGSELFGAKSGNGFADLAQYDDDDNGWIDENDSIFAKLKIWAKDTNGNDILYSLKDKDVGAIHLGYADTNYTLRNESDGNIAGAIRRTGVFLSEDGEAHTMAHVDIAVAS